MVLAHRLPFNYPSRAYSDEPVLDLAQLFSQFLDIFIEVVLTQGRFRVKK